MNQKVRRCTTKPVISDDNKTCPSHPSNTTPIPGSGAPERGVWNKTEALERLGGDEDLLRELCQIFLEESPKLLEKLRDAVFSKDTEAVRRAAHGLKGELGYLGATKAVQAASELEDMGHANNLSRARESFAVLDCEFAALRLSLRTSAEKIS